LNSEEYIVVCNDIEAFKVTFSSPNAIGDFDFGLSKRGDIISLYNDSNHLIDRMEYKVVYPWPVSANSISLTDPMQENSTPNFWQNTESSKTPGVQNDIVIPTQIVVPEMLTFSMHDAYPNPFTRFTSITYELTQSDRVAINLYDTHGRLVRCLVNADHEPGSYTTRISGAELNIGIYYCVMECSEGIVAKKLILL
jgi:hypothetical protein